MVTDRDGAVKQKCTYDAWGRRTLVSGSLIFDRGFTGHEHLDEFALINMNGRMYDPVIGRFLSPDPYVQSPLYAQSFNRYSYAWNNPLVYTDPNGEFLGLALFIFGSGLMKMVFDGQQSDGSWSWKAAGKGFLQGMALSGAMVGSVYLSALPGMLGTTGFFPSALLYGGGTFASSAITSGVTSWNMTGNFNVDWKSAAIMGGISGLMGGIGGYMDAKAKGLNPLTGKGTGIIHESPAGQAVSGNSYFKTEEELNAYAKEQKINFKDYGVSEVTITKDPLDVISPNHYRGNDGFLYELEKNIAKKLGGFAVVVGKGFTSSTVIYMSQFSSLYDFSVTLNHELIHAFHIMKVPGYGSVKFKNYTESVAYTYSYKYGVAPFRSIIKYGPPQPLIPGITIPTKLFPIP